MLLVRILFFGSDFPLIKQGSAPVKIQKRENFSLLFVQRVDKVLNFLYNKGGKDRKLHKLCRRYAVCFRYFCDVSYPQLRELKAPSVFLHCTTYLCILPAAAGIERIRCSYLHSNMSHVSYPQLRELKAPPAPQGKSSIKCILPAAAGIESMHKNHDNQQPKCILPAAAGIERGGTDVPVRPRRCILPAAAGIESFMPGSARRAARMYLTRSCGN